MKQFHQPQPQIKTPVVLFLKGIAPPVILYVDNTEEFYADLTEIMRNANEKNPKLIERKALGSVKKITMLDTHIAAVAIQEETLMQY